jgi:hypothetical protein
MKLFRNARSVPSRIIGFLINSAGRRPSASQWGKEGKCNSELRLASVEPTGMLTLLDGCLGKKRQDASL